jgi:hypothetical protein
MADNAFSPPTEAAIAMIGNERLPDASESLGRVMGTDFVDRRSEMNFSFMLWQF